MTGSVPRFGLLAGVLTLTILTWNRTAEAAPPNEHESEVRTLVENEIDISGPGVAVLVSRNGTPIHLAGYGLANIKARLPITPDSLFDLASVSKHMTGVAILTLVEQRKLKIDEPVAHYLKDFAVPQKGRPVKVADLLYHVSGLADYTGDEWDGSDEEFASLTTEAHLKWLNGTAPRRAPGVKYQYNNSEYALLALIVERLSKQTFACYVHDHLFAPAGMKHTVVLDGTAKLPSSAVVGYETNDDGKVSLSSSPTVITGDGSVYTSVRDLALWDKALRDHIILNKQSQELAWSGGRYDNSKPIRDEDGDGYGVGWVIENKRHLVSHSGSWSGTATYLLLDLERGYTVAVLSNDEKTEVGHLAEKILTLFSKDKDR
ncbi:MAG: beta-lactamase family protein [Verrucomicrobiota bacterium]|nr:beta-lactamase family protein [Verrucomicrobiota bacterium]